MRLCWVLNSYKIASETGSKLTESCPDIHAKTVFPTSSPEKHQYNKIIYIGRFQPPHIGHLWTAAAATQKADHLIIVIGSTNEEKTDRNPYTFKQRLALMKMSVYQHKTQHPDAWNLHTKISYIGMPDMQEDNDWNQLLITEVHKVDKDHTASSNIEGEFYDQRKIAIAGCEKDQSTENYLRQVSHHTGFPLEKSPSLENDGHMINATDIRKILSENKKNTGMNESDREKLRLSVMPLPLAWLRLINNL